ncbi:hypothetical protein PV325_001956, partial [Microctonus aethiopoides]
MNNTSLLLSSKGLKSKEYVSISEHIFCFSNSALSCCRERKGVYYETVVPDETSKAPGSKIGDKPTASTSVGGLIKLGKKHGQLQDQIIELDEKNPLFGTSLHPGDEALPWRKGRVDHSQLSQTIAWRKDIVKSQDDSLEEPQQARMTGSIEVKPWTEENVVLKKAPHIIRQIPRETLEEVELRPCKPEKHQIVKEGVESVELKAIPKDTTDETILTNLLTEDYIEKEDDARLEISRDEEINIKQEPKSWIQEKIQLKPSAPIKKETPKETFETVKLKPAKLEEKFSQPKLQKIDLKSEKNDVPTRDKKITEIGEYIEEEESTNVTVSEKAEVSTGSFSQPKPWIEEKVVLKKSKPIKKEIFKETIEPVELKPSKIERREIRKSSIEKVELRPLTKDMIDDMSLTSEYYEEDDSSLMEVSEISEDISIRRVKRPDRSELILERPDQPKPWTEEKIILKKSIPMRKEITKENLQTVELKPAKPRKREIQKLGIEKVGLKSFTQEVSETKLSSTSDYVTEEDTTLLEVYEDISIERKKQPIRPEISTAKDDNIKPWTDEKISLKPSKIIKQEIVRETIEPVELTKVKTEKKEIRKVSIGQVDLKPIPKDKILTDEPSKSTTDFRITEDTTLLDISEKESINIVQRKPEDKISLKPQIRNEKPEKTIETIDSKPTKPEQKEMKKTLVETIDSKKITKNIIDEQLKTEEYIEEDTSSRLDISKREQLEVSIGQLEKQKPWTEEKVILKKSKPIQREINKQTVETVELRRGRPKIQEITKEKMETVELKPIKKSTRVEENKSVTEDTSIVNYTEEDDSNLIKLTSEEIIVEDRTAKDTRISLRLERKKPEQAPYQETEDSQLLQVNKEEEVSKKYPLTEETAENILKPESAKLDEKSETEQPEEVAQIPWIRNKKLKKTLEPQEVKLEEQPVVEQPNVETQLPWMRNKKPRRVIEKNEEQIEDKKFVTLKPVQKIRKVEVQDEKEQIVLKTIKRETKETEASTEIYHEEEDLRTLEVNEEIDEKEKKPEEVAIPWARGKKPKKVDKPSELVPQALQLENPTVKKEVEKTAASWRRENKKLKEVGPEFAENKTILIEEKTEEVPTKTEFAVPWRKELKKPKKILPVEVESQERTTQMAQPDETQLLESAQLPSIRKKPERIIEAKEELVESIGSIILKPIKHHEKLEENKSTEEITQKKLEELSPKMVENELGKEEPNETSRVPWQRKPKTQKIKKSSSTEKQPEDIVQEKKDISDIQIIQPQATKSIEKPAVKQSEVEDWKSVALKPTKRSKRLEDQKDTAKITLQPVNRSPKEKETIKESKPKLMSKEESQETVPRKIEEKPEQEIPFETTEAPWRRKPKNVTIKKTVSIEDQPEEMIEKLEEFPKNELVERKPAKVVEKTVVKEAEIEDWKLVTLKPTKRAKKSEEPKEQEEVTLKPTKRIPREEETTEQVKLKPISYEEKPEKKEQLNAELQPLALEESLKQMSEEKTTLSWTSGKKKPKTQEHIEKNQPEKIPEGRGESAEKLETTQISWRTRSKPIQNKQEDEKVALKPVKRLSKETEIKEEVHLKPVKRLPKETEIKEEVHLKPVKRLPKETEIKEEVHLKPVKHLPKETEIKEEVHLKPVQRSVPDDKKSDDIQLKLTQQPVPKPEAIETIKLKPISKTPKVKDDVPEENKLKPVSRDKLEEEIPETIMLKPVLKPKKVLQEVQKPHEEQPAEISIAPWRRDKKPKKPIEHKVQEFEEEYVETPEAVKPEENQPKVIPTVAPTLAKVSSENLTKEEETISAIVTERKKKSKKTKKAVEFSEDIEVVSIDQDRIVHELEKIEPSEISQSSKVTTQKEQKPLEPLAVVPKTKNDEVEVAEEKIVEKITLKRGRKIIKPEDEKPEQIVLKP